MPELMLDAREHVMAQLAACRRAAGLALVPEPALFELRGPAWELGVIAQRLTGRRPAAGTCVRMRHGWWRTEASGRALVLADGPELEPRLEDVVASRPDVALSDLSAAHAGLVLVGPLAGRLAASPAARLARPVIAACDGNDYWLLVLPQDRAGDARHVLLAAGRADGAVVVGVRATELHRAARRIRVAQRRPIDTTPTGATSS
jgi:hypothetical protein